MKNTILLLTVVSCIIAMFGCDPKENVEPVSTQKNIKPVSARNQGQANARTLSDEKSFSNTFNLTYDELRLYENFSIDSLSKKLNLSQEDSAVFLNSMMINTLVTVASSNWRQHGVSPRDSVTSNTFDFNELLKNADISKDSEEFKAAIQIAALFKDNFNISAMKSTLSNMELSIRNNTLLKDDVQERLAALVSHIRLNLDEICNTIGAKYSKTKVFGIGGIIGAIIDTFAFGPSFWRVIRSLVGYAVVIAIVFPGAPLLAVIATGAAIFGAISVSGNICFGNFDCFLGFERCDTGACVY